MIKEFTMKKRFLAFLLAVCVAVSMLVLPASAVGSNAAVQTATALGGLTAEQAGSLGAPLTRGQAARLLTAFSAYRDTTTAQGRTGRLYSDVDSDSPYAVYIRTAVQNGWMTGYSDGSFRPDNTVTLEEACTMALRLLGYDVAKLGGTFPTAQLSKASALGLRNEINARQGETLTLEQGTMLFYNALTAMNGSGQVYASTLGFAVSNGQVDISSVLLDNVKGPFVADVSTVLPFAPAAIYRNDEVTTSAALSPYDVYYYNESARTVWIYNKRAAGRVTAVSPSASAPTSVTVAGVTYTIASPSVAYQLSSLSGGGVGQVVTLLLGMNNVAAGIITGEEADEVFYGVVQSSARNLIDEDNSADVLQTVKVLCTDGLAREVNVDKSLNFPTGWLVEVRVSPEGESVEKIDERSVSGTVNENATALGDMALADDVQILDTSTGGVAGTVRPSRLAGTDLNLLNVRYYTLNEKGEIDRLILNDVTGDLWTYGVLDDIKNVAVNYSELQTLAKIISTGKSDSTDTQDKIVDDLKDVLVPTTSEVLWGVINGDILSTLWQKITANTDSLLSLGLRQVGSLVGEPYASIFRYIGGGATYVCYVNGSQVAFTTNVKYPVLVGGVAARRETTGSVRTMVQLMPMKIDQVGAASVMSNGTRFEMADDAQVYLWYKGQYYATKLTEVNSEGYYLTGWYDNFGCAAGKRVRVIVAVKKD